MAWYAHRCVENGFYKCLKAQVISLYIAYHKTPPPRQKSYCGLPKLAYPKNYVYSYKVGKYLNKTFTIYLASITSDDLLPWLMCPGAEQTGLCPTGSSDNLSLAAHRGHLASESWVKHHWAASLCCWNTADGWLRQFCASSDVSSLSHCHFCVWGVKAVAEEEAHFWQRRECI